MEINIIDILFLVKNFMFIKNKKILNHIFFDIIYLFYYMYFINNI